MESASLDLRPCLDAPYIMMAMAAAMALRQGGLVRSRWALIMFVIQLVLNAAWSAFFLPCNVHYWLLLIW